jgi:Zn-dependent M28 family amino/carboxypeptidase
MRITMVLLAAALGAALVAAVVAESTSKFDFSSDELLADIKTLSSDKFEGRGPGSAGEKLTVAFLTERFQKLGLKPGNPDGTYVQKVPMVGITAEMTDELTFIPTAPGATSDQAIRLKFPADYVAFTSRVAAESSFDAPVVFVGYGVVAPEFGWDDYKGVDVKGKVVVMLINDPPVPDPKDPTKLDPKMFRGKAMTYYGRWTYKYEIAAKKGAAGCLIVHETEPAAYGWDVVSSSWGSTRFVTTGSDNNMGRIPVEGWITHERAGELFDYPALKKAAVSKSFRPVTLPWTAHIKFHNSLKMVDSQNVVAKLEGSDPALRDQYVIYSAHWDHFGIGPEVKGQTIYHGAQDNASGTAALLQWARAFKHLDKAPKRSLLFIAVTGEEQGLLGSEYYALHPLYPLKKTAAVINKDVINVYGRTKDLTIVGLRMYTLEDDLEAAAKAQGRRVDGDPEPEKGHYYRSDHFSFAKQGVPALETGSGVDYVGKPEGWGLKKREEYVANDYHKPSDVVRPDWDLSGALEDMDLLMTVGLKVANSSTWPQWKPGTEFKAKRDAMMKK